METSGFGNRCVSNHTAAVFDKGGKKRIGPLLDLSYVRWERTRDGISEGMVRVEGDSCSAQADFIGKIRSHRHELVIFRGNQRVWEGPLHRAGIEGDHAEFVARDVSEYLWKTPLTQDWDNSHAAEGAVAVSTRIGEIIQYEITHGRQQFYADGPDAAEAVAEWTAAGGTLTPVTGGWLVDIPALEDDSIFPAINMVDYLVVHNWPNEARTSAFTVPYQMSVGEHLQNLARRAGIDYTVIGRSLHIWDVSRNLGVLGQWTEANFRANVAVTEYGADHTQSSYVIGQDGTYGSSLNLKNLAYYGPWTTIFTSYNEEGSADPTLNQLNSQARRNLSGRSPAPIEVRVPDGSSLILTDNLTINHLVPGVQVPLRATLNARKLVQQQKIDHVRVEENPDGEEIKVTLTPATKPDADDEEV